MSTVKRAKVRYTVKDGAIRKINKLKKILKISS